MARKRSKNQPGPSPAMMMARTPRVPRFNIRGSIADQTVLSGNRRVVLTVAAGAGHQAVFLDINGIRVADPIADVGSLYRQYKYLPGTTFHWIPSVALTSTGTVAIAYIDNPEQIAQWLNQQSESARYDFVTNIGNHKAYPIWKEFTYALTAQPRRLTFDVNSIQAVPSVDDLERSTQGVFVISMQGVLPADGTVARSYLHQKIMLRGLTGSPVG